MLGGILFIFLLAHEMVSGPPRHKLSHRDVKKGEEVLMVKAVHYLYSSVYPAFLESRFPFIQVSEEVNIPIQFSRFVNSEPLNILTNAPKLYLKDTVTYRITWPYMLTYTHYS